jgi:hypothetical protein
VCVRACVRACVGGGFESPAHPTTVLLLTDTSKVRDLPRALFKNSLLILFSSLVTALPFLLFFSVYPVPNTPVTVAQTTLRQRRRNVLPFPSRPRRRHPLALHIVRVGVVHASSYYYTFFLQINSHTTCWTCVQRLRTEEARQATAPPRHRRSRCLLQRDSFTTADRRDAFPLRQTFSALIAVTRRRRRMTAVCTQCSHRCDDQPIITPVQLALPRRGRQRFKRQVRFGVGEHTTINTSTRMAAVTKRRLTTSTILAGQLRKMRRQPHRHRPVHELRWVRRRRPSHRHPSHTAVA